MSNIIKMKIRAFEVDHARPHLTCRAGRVRQSSAIETKECPRIENRKAFTHLKGDILLHLESECHVACHSSVVCLYFESRSASTYAQ